MRIALLAVGCLFLLVGVLFLLVDKIVLHEGVWPPGESELQVIGIADATQRHIDLPDWGGYALVTVAVVCLAYFVALRRQRNRY